MVFKLKIDFDTGAIAKHKSRLVAKGFLQLAGLDYTDTAAPTLASTTLRVIFVIVATLDYEFKHLDVETAFLNAELKEEVYIRLPPGLASSGIPGTEGLKEGQVYRLRKSLYGIKQAPHDWNELINSTLISLSYTRCKTDPCLYIKRSRTNRLIFLPLFVDDMFPAFHKEDTMEWESDKKQLFNKFKMKDLGDAKLILGMRISRDRHQRTLIVDQEIYINRVLEGCNMDTCFPVATPEEDGMKHSAFSKPNSTALTTSASTNAKTDSLEHSLVLSFHSIIGSLLYAALSTRPDISHAVITLSRFVSNPLKQHWTALKRILQYLKGSAKLGLVYRGKQFAIINQLSGITLGPMFTDANWAGDIDDRKSTTGLLLKINGCTVSWKSKKQSVVSLSSAESEYMSLGEGVRETLWLRQFMSELNRCIGGEKCAQE